ncbi:MAG: sigma-70 family RNA polymerase sigma factor [Chloroflexota bacterium]|nr:sigma-70 family RNA polymerase sigma factor [Chloroflexota bacterium]
MADLLTGDPIQADDERVLVARAASDPEAFAPLYLRYFDRIHAYCYRRLGNPEEAADVTSIVFSRTLASIHTFRGDRFRSWLFAIAHNALADHYRHRRPERSLDDAAWLLDQHPSPEDEAIAHEAQRTVSSLLAGLPEEQRHVVELRLAGLTSKEIGTVLGKQANAIDQAQYRAMTRLRVLAASAGSGVEDWQ